MISKKEALVKNVAELRALLMKFDDEITFSEGQQILLDEKQYEYLLNIRSKSADIYKLIMYSDYKDIQKIRPCFF